MDRGKNKENRGPEADLQHDQAAGHKSQTGALTGMVRAVPIILGYLPVGLAFGVLATTNGLSPFGALGMSIFVFAGSAQLISVGMIGAGANVAAITTTVFLVNLRHLLMSAYLAPYLKRLKIWQLALFSYELTDETFAVHSAFFRRSGVPPSAELFALNHSSHLAWIIGTILGVWIGGRINFDIEAIGIDYALPAMFIALLVMQIDNVRRVFIALLAAAIGLFLYLAGMSQFYIIAATVIAATAGVIMEYREEKNSSSPADGGENPGGEERRREELEKNIHDGEKNGGQKSGRVKGEGQKTTAESPGGEEKESNR
ncbi:MAG TPA: branched-chain amino acid ABC transporter permease [Firmicutes bacterium]|nr:branched-chain amino acid ABC transporter permease [Bacillota bacterium]